jgi:hypothetical protein
MATHKELLWMKAIAHELVHLIHCVLVVLFKLQTFKLIQLPCSVSIWKGSDLGECQGVNIVRDRERRGSEE